MGKLFHKRCFTPDLHRDRSNTRFANSYYAGQCQLFCNYFVSQIVVFRDCDGFQFVFFKSINLLKNLVACFVPQRGLA